MEKVEKNKKMQRVDPQYHLKINLKVESNHLSKDKILNQRETRLTWRTFKD
jgi:hypothetical protein